MGLFERFKTQTRLPQRQHEPEAVRPLQARQAAEAALPLLMTLIQLRVLILLIFSVFSPSTACPARPAAVDICSPQDAPTLHELSRVHLIAPCVVELNPDSRSKTAPSISTKSSGTKLNHTSNSSSTASFSSPPSQPVGASNLDSAGSSSSNDLLTTLSVVVLFNNLMPRLSPAWALATTAAAWMWLAFKRLQPWLAQTSTPMQQSYGQIQSSGSMSAASVSGSDALAAAAGLSPAAAAAAADSGMHSNPGTRWWHHALLFLELFAGNAADSLLLMGLLLLPFIALRRWVRGKQMWGSMAGFVTPPTANTPTAAATAATSASTAALEAEPAGEAMPENALRTAARNSLEGFSNQLQSAGHSAARLASAMKRIGGNARRRNSLDSAATTSGSSTPSSGTGSGDGQSPSAAQGSPAGRTSSRTGSMVSPEQSYGLVQPTTPPLMYVAHADGPLGASSLHMRLAAPLQPSPTNEVKTGCDSAAAAAAAAVPGTPTAATSTWPKPQPTPCPAAAGDSSSDNAKPAGSASHSSSSSDVSSAARGVTQVTPADSSQQSSCVDAAPSGAHTDSGNSEVGGASLNLGTIGTIRGISTRGVLPPMYPTRSLYNSPLETVVISCKLANSSNIATAQQQYNTAAYTGPFTATANTPTATQASGSSGSAGFSTAGGLGVQGSRVQVPLSPAQASLGQGGHGSSVVAQRELRAVVEAAVREAVAESNVAVLSTTVTSFPGCVHVVATVNLAALAAAAAEAVVADGMSQSLAERVVWQQIVQQIIQGQQQGGAGTEGQAGTAADECVLAREGLCLKHLLVQDTAGNVKYLWVSPEAADSTDASPAGADMPLTSASSSNAASEADMAVGSSSGSTRSSISSLQTAPDLTWQLLAAAEGICLSSYGLATDAAGDRGELAAAPAASKLQLPVGFADALIAAGAGLRLVLSGTPHPAPTIGLAATPGTHLQAPYLPAAAHHASAADSTSRGGSSRVSLSDDEARFQQRQHLLADVTLWPGSSSWPMDAQLDVLQLLPSGMTPAVLAEQFGRVLNINIVASTGQASGAKQSAQGSSSAHVARTSSHEMQGDTPAVTGRGAADIAHSTLAAEGAAERGAPMQVASQHAPRTVSEELQRHISQLVARLNANAASGTTPTDADLTLLQPSALEAAAAAAVVAAAAPAPAPAPGVTPAPATHREPERQQQQQPMGEHLLLQLPLLLLPASACEELTQLQQRMVTELGPAGSTAAAQRHMLPLFKDIAAAFNMSAAAQQQQQQLDAPAPAPAAAAAATLGLTGVRALVAGHSAAAGAPPEHQAAADTPAAALSTEQKHMLKQLLQFLSDQELDTLAAALCSHMHINDLRQLAVLQHQQQQHAGPATTEITEAQLGPGSRDSRAQGPAGTYRTPESDAQLSTGAGASQQAGDHGTRAAPAAAASEIPAGLPSHSSEPVGQQHARTPAAPSAAAAAEKAETAAGAAGGAAAGPNQHVHHGKQAAKALEQASAAHQQAAAAQRAAAATESALQIALQQISALSAATAEARRQAADAEAAAAAATQRAAAVEQQSERQRALQLISGPAGGPASAGSRGVGIWGLLGGSSRAVAAARAAGTSLLGGVMRAAEPPMVPQDVSPRDVLLGFEDERLEVQYRRMKALQCRSIDRAALVMQLFRQAVYVWRIARLMYVAAGTGLSLVLLCKYEAVVLLPYVMLLLTPDFYIYHRHLLLCLSQIAAALTVGMIATTEVYRNEWTALLQRPGPTLLARPPMMLLWYYLLVPILQQQTLPEQAITCVAQLAHSLLIYVYILKGTTSLWLVVPLLLAASGVSFGVTYVADAWTRRQAVAGTRRTLMRAE